VGLPRRSRVRPQVEMRQAELKLKVEMAKFLTQVSSRGNHNYLHSPPLPKNSHPLVLYGCSSAQTLDTMAMESASSQGVSEEIKAVSNFLAQPRDAAASISTADIIKYAKVFDNELTLDNLSRQQLSALCKLLSLNSCGRIAHPPSLFYSSFCSPPSSRK
jgi:hypothetical protein